MDPKANIERQRELAHWLLNSPSALTGPQATAAAQELAELVQALDEWRVSGGFDPYGA